MIQVQQLTKRYASHTAVKEISFEVGKGEIVGFLGPNGAGKSTTMKILSGYMPATSGTATVAGFDVFQQSLEVRRRIGYMPENVPLYLEMRVREYLTFRAKLKGVQGRRVRLRLNEVTDLCSLQEVINKPIGALSKGYRQRVALADAMIHEPELLILDEPTIGLDPNQIRQVRDLIKDLGQRHTILLSTHILSEVELTCSRVIIINRGRIQASDTPENLQKKIRTAGTIKIEAKTGSDDASAILKKLDGVRDIRVTPQDDWSLIDLRIEADRDLREEIFRLAVDRKWQLRELTGIRATLEDVFVEMTQSDIV